MVEFYMFIPVSILFILLTYFISKNNFANNLKKRAEELSRYSEQNHFYEKENAELKLKNERLENELKTSELKNVRESEEIKFLKQKLIEQKEVTEDLNKKMHMEFKNLANEILEEKSKKFTDLNKSQLDIILNPLKEKIKDFEDKVEKSYKVESGERNALKGQIEQLVELNKQISDDAKNLSSALKGNVKIRGNWGEDILERILENTGLQKNIHYFKEKSHLDNEQSRKRPDFIINMPDNKQFIIDSKVSLIAYEEYFLSKSEDEKTRSLKQLILSIKRHIDDLSSKDYQLLDQVSSADYVMLFIPIEPAYLIALNEDRNLFEFAWKKNVLLVSPSNLIAMLKTVNYIWQQDNQNKNVKEIARLSGTMLDKFSSFLADLNEIEKHIDKSKDVFLKAKNKLSDGRANLISQAEKIKKLGAKVTKDLPENYTMISDD